MATSTAVSTSASNVFAPTPQFTRPTFLMCPPEWYGVDYVLNPWMAGNVNRSSRDLAFAQWKVAPLPQYAAGYPPTAYPPAYPPAAYPPAAPPPANPSDTFPRS